MEERKRGSDVGTKLLMVLLGILLLVIAGLVVVLIINSIPKEEPVYEDGTVGAMNTVIENRDAATSRCKRIRADFNNGKMTYEDALEDYKAELSGGTSMYDLYIAICYAEFMAEEGGQVNEAREFLSGYAEAAEEQYTVAKIDYYYAMVDLYGDENCGCQDCDNKLCEKDEETIDYYMQKIDDIAMESSPEDPMGGYDGEVIEEEEYE